MQVLARDPGRKLERRAAHGLAIRAMTNLYQTGVDACLPGDVSEKAGAVYLHDESATDSEHLVGKELEYDRVLHAQQHAADFAALGRLFPGAQPFDDPLAGSNQ